MRCWAAGKLKAASRAFYQKPPDVTTISAWGLSLGDFDEVFEVWPENWPAFLLFARVNTQWRENGFDPVGLDYSAVYPLLDRTCNSQLEWEEMFDDIRDMEAAAIAVIRKSREQDGVGD